MEKKQLTDGLRGGWNYNDKRWLGFANNHRMDVVIDLEKVTKIHSVSADFMQIVGTLCIYAIQKLSYHLLLMVKIILN